MSSFDAQLQAWHDRENLRYGEDEGPPSDEPATPQEWSALVEQLQQERAVAWEISNQYVQLLGDRDRRIEGLQRRVRELESELRQRMGAPAERETNTR